MDKAKEFLPRQDNGQSQRSLFKYGNQSAG